MSRLGWSEPREAARRMRWDGVPNVVAMLVTAMAVPTVVCAAVVFVTGVELIPLGLKAFTGIVVTNGALVVTGLAAWFVTALVARALGAGVLGLPRRHSSLTRAAPACAPPSSVRRRRAGTAAPPWTA